MSYRRISVSPSALAATEHCPRFRPDGKENDAAAEGTLLHEKLQEMVSQPKNQWPAWIQLQDLSADHKGLLQVAAADLDALVEDGLPTYQEKRIKPRAGKPRKSPLRPGLYPELEIETTPGHHGYIDLLIVTWDGIGIIVDYKMVRSEKDYSLQLSSYAVYLHRLVPSFKLFEARIIAPRLYGDPEVHHWTEEDMPALAERIDRIEQMADDSGNDPAILGQPGDQCTYCHWNGRCPYQAASIAKAFPPSSEIPVAIPENRVMIHPETPEERGNRRSCIKFLEAFVKAAKEDDKAWVEENGGLKIDPAAVPGWKISWRNGRSSLESDRLPEVRTALMEKLDFSIDDVLDVSDVSTGKVVERLSLKYGYPEKTAKAEMQKALDEFMRPAGKVLYWTQSKSAKTLRGGPATELLMND